MQLFELKRERKSLLDKADDIISAAEREKRGFTATEKTTLDSHNNKIAALNSQIRAIEEANTITKVFGPRGAFGIGNETSHATSATNPEHPGVAAFRGQFAAWMNNALQALGGGKPAMEATAPSGPISVGSGSGLDSIAVTIPTEILPYLPSYYALDSFGLAGATQFFTDHTRPLTKPILSAGAPDAVVAENAAATTSQPFGLSGFTFGGSKYERLVLASYESLMNSELPLQGAIMDELLATLATTLTTATTTAFVAALTAASSTLEVGAVGSGGSVYTSMIDLRHAVPPRFDLPTNCWMLSRATLAQIRNTRASTSGVPMFDPTANTIFDRPYVINDNLDTVSGGGVGFVAFGSFADGVWLRRTPVISRVFLELFANAGQVGFRTTQWADAHFLAELVGAPQPPTNQPLYYTSIASES